jgi:lipopolysaccharide export system protein LptA
MAGMLHSFIRFLPALAAALFSIAAMALPDDTRQPIHIVADEAVRDEKSGLTVYRGNVEMNQGSISISADRITIYSVDNDADRIVAEGSPAHMQHTQKVDAAPMHAEGAIIEYFKNEERVQLRQNAMLEQDGTTVRGDRIEYFIDQELVKAATDSESSPRRVEVVIPPGKLEE